MPSSSPLRIVLAGRGDVLNGYLTLARSLKSEGMVEIVAVIDPEAERPDASGPAPDGRYVTAEFAELIRSDAVDAVLVLTSIYSHAPLAVAALGAGKHVLLEKPIGVTLAEARQVLECARQAPGLLVCAPHVLLSPTYQTMARRVRAGDIGKVVTARARYGWSGGWLGHWLDRGADGALVDLGIYNLTSLLGLLGPVRQVTAFTATAVPQREIRGKLTPVDAIDNAHVVLDFGDGVLAVLTTGFVMEKYKSPAIELYGTLGTIQMLGDDWAPQGYELWQNDVGAWQVFPETNPEWRWADGLRHLAVCVREGTRPLTAPGMAYHALEVMRAAETSGETGRTQPVHSTIAPPDWDAAL
jgi:predicted dehydrogenase